MPKTTITHELWCAEHLGDAEGLRETCCTSTAAFGTLVPVHPGEEVDEDMDRRGSLYVDTAEDETEPNVILEYHFPPVVPLGSGRLDVQALRAVRAAVADDPEGFVRAIDETLNVLDARVTA
jgi:hypothetical protein